MMQTLVHTFRANEGSPSVSFEGKESAIPCHLEGFSDCILEDTDSSVSLPDV